MKCQYESEILYDLMKGDGLLNPPQNNLPYESELKEKYVNDVVGAYPKLNDYRAEWLNYALNEKPFGEFPYITLTNVTNATIENVVPFAYQSAILKGSTKYRDIDTGEILEAFEEGRNLELVSVKMPVLTTTGKNTFNIKNAGVNRAGWYSIPLESSFSGEIYIKVAESLPSDFRVNILVNKTENPLLNSQIKNGYTGEFQNVTSIDFHCPSLLIGEGLRGKLDELIANKNIMINLGGEPYKAIILTVNEEVELRGIGEGLNRVEDELDCLTGEVVERIGEIVLDGSENWIQDAKNDTYASFLLRGTGSKINCFCVCDKLPQKNKPIYNLNSEGVVTGGSVGDLLIFIKKERLNTDSLSGFKEWLSQNPITVQYPLATESVKTVDLTTVNEKGETTHFMPLEGTMHVQSSGEIIQPTFDMSVPVEATTQNLASFIDLEME